MRKRFTLALLYMLGVIILGSIGYMQLEGLSFFQAVYFTIATITTVGYGDITPHTVGGKLLSMGIMMIGVGVALYFASTTVGLVIEGRIAEMLGRRIMHKQLKKLKDHIIICGAGRVGYQVIERLKKEDVQFVVVEQEEKIVEQLRQEGVLAVAGDATQDALLVDLGIEHAKGLITALPDDAQNVFVTLTSKGLNPKLSVVARMDRVESESKLRRAGADKVISPAILGGRRMAISILKPVSVDYVDTVMHDKELEMEIEEISINAISQLVGRTVENSRLKDQTGTIILAIMRQKQVISNPSVSETFADGDLLIVLGTREQLTKLESIASG
ncbi:MAG TPA: potassium channel protein, partial [Verrucomicrobiae bacterium]|nr:potassium channel protein [Verrucomicrobiae bacterium]